MRPASETRTSRLMGLLILFATVLLSTIALPAHAADNLLTGRSPARAAGVSNAKVLTDGARAQEGEEWNTSAAAVFESERSFVEYDLGRSVRITDAYLQGDNNDEYVVSISEDRNNFSPLWTAGQRAEPGLRERFSGGLEGQGRYVRLVVRGGDRAYSVTELQLFSEHPAVMPPQLPRVTGENQASRVRTDILYFVAAFAVFLFWTQAGSKPARLALGALLPLIAALITLNAIDSAWPLANREVSFVRASAAAIALLALLRRVALGKSRPAHRWAITSALVVSAVMASAAFYNLGRPQFWNHAEKRQEFVHTYDMRVYQPFARYFKELQYDGVYLASVLAYAEDQRGGSLESMARTEVRSLVDHRVRHVGDIGGEIQELRKRFTDERWASLKQDMRYFEEVMGPEFLGTLTDHGANATPVWVFFARLVLGHSAATEGLLTFAGLVDAILLSLMAIAMWRSFGLWPALLSVTLFGANDLYMFGTNWTGATLRHDWMALLGFGACALKKERWALAGICLGLSTMIRAFPGAALIGVSLPALWAISDGYRREGKLPKLRALLQEHPEAVRVVGSAIATMVAAVLVTGVLYGFHSWINWWHKVTLLNRDVGINEISLRALVAGADAAAGRTMQARRGILIAAQLGSVALVAIACRKRPLHQAMVLSVPLVLVLFNPSNYYSHFVFLLALLGSVSVSRKASADAAAAATGTEPKTVPLLVPLHQVGGPLLGLCIAGYWAALDPDLDRHFQDSTVLLFVALAFLFANVLRRDPAVKAVLSA